MIGQQFAPVRRLLGAESLLPSATASRLQRVAGKNTWTDGPFAESKELIAGVSVYRASTKAEAIEWARRQLQIHVEGTGIGSGEIEVRRIFESDELPLSPEQRKNSWRERLELRERLVG